MRSSARRFWRSGPRANTLRRRWRLMPQRSRGAIQSIAEHPIPGHLTPRGPMPRCPTPGAHRLRSLPGRSNTPCFWRWRSSCLATRSPSDGSFEAGSAAFDGLIRYGPGHRAELCHPPFRHPTAEAVGLVLQGGGMLMGRQRAPALTQADTGCAGACDASETLSGTSRPACALPSCHCRRPQPPLETPVIARGAGATGSRSGCPRRGPSLRCRASGGRAAPENR